VSTQNEALHGALATRRSPLHDQLARQGARFGTSGDWAYPLWFAHGDGTTPAARHAAHEAEHLRTRRTVGVFDVSLLGHLLVVGPDATSLLNRVSTSQIDVEIGRIVYTQWCNEAGLIQADVIVARLRADRFMVVVGDTVQRRCVELLEASTTAHHENAHVIDITSGYAIITIAGPKSEAVMQRLDTHDSDLHTLAPMRALELSIGKRPVIVMTVSYTGERSFEVHVPTEYAAALYAEISAAAVAEGGGPCGVDAMYSLGTENGSLDYDYDLDGTVTPLEAGLGHLIGWDKPAGFVGRDALDLQRLAGPLRTRIIGARTCPFGDGVPTPFRRGDVVFRHDVPVGHVLSATVGHSVNAVVGMIKLHHAGGITEEWLSADHWHIDHQGVRLPVSFFSGRLQPTPLAVAVLH
jgi:glycine cleavage system aminomethyltransferase T